MILLEKFIDVDDFCKVCYLLGNTYYLKTVPGAAWMYIHSLPAKPTPSA